MRHAHRDLEPLSSNAPAPTWNSLNYLVRFVIGESCELLVMKKFAGIESVIGVSYIGNGDSFIRLEDSASAKGKEEDVNKLGGGI